MTDSIRSRLWIHNEAVDAASGETFDTVNPATGATLASVARGSAVDIDRAVASARE
ncbi:MAG: aldehyde dehydrogenase family protein, partial [Gemmatimonadetes bacterium]|nr:aldehyde dehydrogenase family protein [Gemmatimonadota bacterium]